MKLIVKIFCFVLVSILFSNYADGKKVDGVKTGGKKMSTKAEHFSEGLAAVEVDGKWGFMDKKGDYVIKPQFLKVLPFSEGLAAVYTDNKVGFIDKKGNHIIKSQFDEVRSFNEGLAAVKTGGFWGPWGYIDKKGNYVIKPQFDDAWPFIDGVAMVVTGAESKVLEIGKTIKTGGNAKFIDKKGNPVINPKLNEEWGLKINSDPRMKMSLRGKIDHPDR